MKKKTRTYWKRITALLLGVIVTISTGIGVMSAEAAQKEESQTQMSVRGATIWPIEDLAMYNNRGEELAVIPAGTPLRALTLSQEYFKVYYEGNMGIIDSNYCMINLPDVMQEEMQYDITNSYYSIYKIHGEAIDGVTGEVLYPYAMVGEEEYLVPLLYPVAAKLYEAEADALEQGYTLKVYDAYRPYAVTQEIYQKTSAFIEENPIYGEYMTEPINGENYKQSNFLAKSVSNHNYGVAVDITLAKLDTREELSMQAPMHELSTRAIVSLNNENADLLKKIMYAHGFSGIPSEWWHFQIRDCRKSYAAFQASPIG